MLALKILCEQHSFLLYRLHTNLLLLLIFIFPGKNGKSLCKSCKFLGYLLSTSGVYLVSLSSYVFIKSSVN